MPVKQVLASIFRIHRAAIYYRNWSFVMLLVLSAGFIPMQRARALTNGLALTPPMGYNSWYPNGPNISETLIEGVADEMATNGMLAAGYQYINLDDGWAGYRDTNGTIVADTNKFPSGMKALADYVHAKGFKFGLYTTGGTNTCAGYVGSFGHEIQDANTYAAWGVDYVKFEGCNLPYYDELTHAQEYAQRMGNALLKCGHPVVFDLSIQTFENWMPGTVNMWRGTGDDFRSWSDVLHHIDIDSQTAAFAGPGHWSDPDAMIIGWGSIDPIENKAIFSMWSILAAPLIVMGPGNGYLDALTNSEAIAVNQDPAGIQGICVTTNGDLQVWRKPLGSSNSTTIAVALLNRGNNAADITVNWSDLGLPQGVASVRDLWARAYVGNFTNSYTANVPVQGVQFVKIAFGSTVPVPLAGTNYLSDLPWLAGAISPVIPIQLDQAGSLTPITLHGEVYTKGLGTVANTSVSYFLGGAGSRFQSDIGVDDYAGPFFGEVIFQVFADGTKLYDSGVMTTKSPTQTINVDITGKNILTLLTLTNDAGVNSYGDWAGARVVMLPLPPAQPAALTAIPGSQAITLAWYAASGATSYNLKRSTSIGGPYQTIANPTVPSYTDTNVVVGTLYYYLVSTVNSYGESSNSTTVSLMLPTYWNNTVTSMAQNWNSNGNWTNANVFPNGIGAEAVINANIASPQTINLNAGITLGSLTVGDTDGSATYTIAANGGMLTFDNGVSTSMLIQSATSKGDTISAPFIANGSLVINNYSTNPLILSGTNSISNVITLAQGALRMGNASVLGTMPGGVMVTNGATLDLNGFSLGAGQLTVSGTGAGGNGAIISTAATPQLNALQSVTLAGDTTFGGTGRWDIRGTNNSVAFAILSTKGNPYNLTKVGGNQISLGAVNVDAALGNIDIQQGIMSFENATTSMGNSTNTLTVESSATLSFSQTTGGWNKVFVLNGDGLSSTINNSGGSNTMAGLVTLYGNCILSVSGTALTLDGPVTGAGNLNKTMGSPLYLYGTNTYTGSTVINSGALAVMGFGSIATTTNISVAAGALLDVSGMNGGSMTLAGGQTLSGSGSVNGNVTVGAGATLTPAAPFGTLTFSNALTLAAGSQSVLGISKSPKTNGQVRALGHLTYGGTLVVNILGTNALASGDSFKIFDGASYSGGFANVIPLIPGSGLLWDTSLLSSNGTLRAVGGTLPSFNSFAFRGNHITFNGAGGTSSNSTYYVLASTNAAIPLFQWTVIATNQFDQNGNFSFTNTVGPNAPGMFYRLKLP